ncbi:MAG: tRNA (adenosine(37)-N6)-threonylcarbamoyltransferase complex ATPase subunit type 1 TsaE [Alphaproteobacteria bacterium]
MGLSAKEVVGTGEMLQLAASLAPRLEARDFVGLRGELGAGKTTFARGVIRALGGGEDVPSPTFTLVQVYDTRSAPVWHFDLYRLAHPEDVYELGFEEARAEAIALVEWPERLGPLLPGDRIDVLIDYTNDPKKRRVALEGRGTAVRRIPSEGDVR